MKIKKISITGMHKVAQKTYEFNDGVTYFVGENGSGKSTILEAIQLGLLGYIPGYAKTNEAIIKHASGPVLAVSLVIEGENSIKIDRTWMRSGSSVKSTLSVEGYDSKDIDKLIADIELPIFNFNEFKSLTSNKLKEWFISFLPNDSSEFDLQSELVKAVEGRSLPHLLLLNNIMDRAKKSKLTGLELVKSVNSWIKDDQSFIKGQINKLQSTIESLVRYDDAEIIDEDEITSEIQDLTKLIDEIARYESAKNIYQRALESIEDLKESLPADSYSADPRIAEMSAKIEVLQNENKQLQEQFNSLQNDKMKLVQEKGSISNIGKDSCPFTKQHCDIIAKISNEASQKLSKLNSKISEIDAEIAKCDASVIQAKDNECKQLLANMEFIRGQYSKLSALQSQIVDPGEAPTDKNIFELRDRINTLNSDLAKVKANKRFDELMEQVTKDKYEAENSLEVLKIWDKTTGANGLQTDLMNKPFQDLASEMSTYLSKMFGSETTANFNLSAKANSFSFGVIRDDSYIEFDYLSSGERCLFTLALIMCILNRSNSSIQTILIDDILDHLDEDNATHLFDTLKTIDSIQFIMAGVKECKHADICKNI